MEMYEESRARIAEADRHVMEMINCKVNPLTRKDLHKMADNFPERWEKYRNLLGGE